MQILVVGNNRKVVLFLRASVLLAFNTFLLFNKELCEVPEASTGNKTDKISALLELMF